MRQFLFYQHNVQRYFLEHLENYQGIVVPLSIAASFLDGTTGFLRALCALDSTKHFFLDPRTPLFQASWNRQNVRAPHKKAAAILGAPFDAGLLGPLQPNQFGQAEIASCTANCIAFQKKFRNHNLEESQKIKKYMKLAGLDQGLPALANPQYFAPPYFKFGAIGDQWHAISMACIVSALKHVGAAVLQPIIHYTPGPELGNWNLLRDFLLELGIQRVCLHPNNFREHESDENGLRRLSERIRSFSQAGLEVMRLHAGYLGIVQQKVGLSAFGNGVGYGEWRESGYHKGGTAERRIYIPRLHRFLEPARAQAVLNLDPYFAEDSDLLTECASFGIPLDSLTPDRITDDFMEVRVHETLSVADSTPAAISAELQQTVSVLEKHGPVELDYAQSLRRWANVITSWV